MATIGQTLTAPEPSWRRYDDSDNRISVLGTQWNYIKSTASGLTVYNNTITALLNVANNGSNYITFKFKGTKLRIISYRNVDHASNIEISIDGVSEYYSSFFDLVQMQALVYEKIGLSDSIHTVVIKSISTGRFALDAIDTDTTGTLIHIKEKFNLKDMLVGDVISCEYTATANSVGAFTNLGNAQKDLIPVASSATPNGSFYFRHTGFDNLGRMKLVPDRNIQHSISWDKINEVGAVTGKSILFNGLDTYRFTTRLLSGGVSSTDTDNEWNKIICESTLDGTITAGANAEWNWSGVSSWTSTVHTTSTNRVIRGNATATTWSGLGSSTVNATTGFRPMLLVEFLLNTRYLIKTTDKIYSLVDGVWIELVGSASQEMYEQYGMEDFLAVDNSKIQELKSQNVDSFRILIWKR